MRVDHVFRALIFAVTELLLLSLWLAGAPGMFCLAVTACVTYQLRRSLQGRPIVLGGWSQIGLYLLALVYLVSVPEHGLLAVAQMTTLLAALAYFGPLDRWSAMFALLCQLLSLLLLQAASQAAGALAVAILVGLPLLGLEWITLSLYESQRLDRRHQRRLARARRQPRPARYTLVGRGFTGVALLILVAFFCAGTLAYVLLPRPYSNRTAGGGGGDDGGLLYGSLRFPDAMEMGSLEWPERNGFVASVQLRIGGEIHRLPESQVLYWKMRSYDHYNGRRWRGEPRMRSIKDADDGKADGRVTLGSAAIPDTALVEQNVRVVPFTPQLLPVVDPPHAIDRAQVWRFEGDGGLIGRGRALDPSGMGRTIGFTAWSRRGRDYPDPGEKADGADERYQQLPGDYLDARALSQGVLRGADSDLMRVRALVNHLRSAYEYSRKFPRPPAGADPVRHFLFESKVGHCELFAGALTLMLRCQGIPARVVGGFMGGQWEELGAYYRISQGDAHAWVEVYFEKTGWVRFDPTPAAGMRAAAAADEGAEDDTDLLVGEGDNAALRELLMMDAQRRDELLSNLLATLAIPLVLVGSMLLALAVIALMRLLRRRQPVDRGAAEIALRARPSSSYFAEAVALLERGGVGRKRSETTGELGARLADERPDASPPYEQLAAGYRAERFGDARPPDAAEAEACLDRLAQALGVARGSAPE